MDAGGYAVAGLVVDAREQVMNQVDNACAAGARSYDAVGGRCTSVRTPVFRLVNRGNRISRGLRSTKMCYVPPVRFAYDLFNDVADISRTMLDKELSNDIAA